jgi:hypothetical protein
MAITGNDLLKKRRGSTNDDEKEKEKSSVKLTGADLLNRHKAYQTADTSAVDQKYIDSFYNDSNAFLTTAEKDHGGLGWGSASSAYESRNNTWQDLNKRADAIGAWLFKNRDTIDPDTYASLTKSIGEIRSGGSSVVDAFKGAADYYSQWDTEDAYNEYKRKEDEKQALMNSADFKQYSQAGASIQNPSLEDVADRGLSIGGKLILGKEGAPVGNVVTMSRDNADHLAFTESNGGNASDYGLRSLYRHMNDDEVAIYNYYLGKGDTQKAAEYLASLEDTLNQRAGQGIADRINGNEALEALFGFGAGIENTMQGIKGLADFFTGGESVPTYSQTQYADQFASQDNEGFNKGLHDVSTAVGGMMPSILVGSLTGGLGGALTMGASAVGNGYAEMRNLGYDEWQSRGYGLLVGASEATLQYALGGISKLGGKVTGNAIGKLVSKFDNAIARTAIKLGGNMASEGLEEAIQTVLEPAFKALIMGETFDAPEWEEVWYSALLGALSAGVLEGVPTIAGEVNVRNQGANLKASGIENVTALADMGKTFADGTVANRLGKKVNEKSGAYDVGRLLQEVGGSLSEKNIADIAADLEAKGMSPEEAMKTAKWMYKPFEGRHYNWMNRRAYSKDERISDVHRELTADRDFLANREAYTDRGFFTNRDVFANSTNQDLSTKEEHSVNKRNAEYAALYELAQEVTKPKGKDAPTQAEASAQQAETTPVTENAPEAEKAVEGEIEASTEGKTTYNGNEVKVTGIAPSENGEVMLQLDNGEVANVRDVDFGGQEEGLIYEAVANMDTDTAIDFIQGFNSMKNAPVATPQTVSDYTLGFNEAHRYGELGIPFEALARDGQYSKSLIGNQAQIAYNRGRINGVNKAASAQRVAPGKTATPRKYKGETHASEIKKSRAYKSLSKMQRAGVDGMTAIYKALGIDVYFFESPTDSKGNRRGKNGYFNPSDNSVHIDLYAGNDGRGLILFTGGHELTHYIRANLPTKFKAFADILFEQYEANGTSVAGLIAKKRQTLEQKGRITPNMTAEEAYDLAYEEVVADACEAMLGNGEAFAQISAKVKAKDEGLWNSIKKFFTDLVSRIKKAYAQFSPDSIEGQKVAEMLETATDLQKMWVDMLVEASEVHGVSMEVTAHDAMTGTDVSDITKKPVQKLQERTEYQEFPKEMIKITSNGAERSPMEIEINGKKFVGSASVRVLRNARFAENKFDPKYVTKVNAMLDKMRDYLAEARVKYTYVGLTDVYNAKIIISPTTGQIVLSGLVNNGDYEINFDFTKTCKKRIALQDIIEQIAREKGRIGEDGIQTEVDLSEENIRHINEVLAANGIETACLCCFVESKRYAMQAHFQEKVCDVWNRLVDEVNAEEDIFKEAPYFDFAKSDVETSKIPDEEYDKMYADVTRWRNYKFEDEGEGEGAIERKMKAFLINTPAARKKLRLSDFITEAGRTNLHKLYPDIESLAKAKIGTALPKAVESFAPYNGEIELLGVSGKEDLATYVKNIAGARSQSFSDFIMAHVYDVLQKTASLTARKLTAHTYTKEISRARLFGMTGEKTNLSVLHEIDPDVDSWNAGFRADGSYFVSDYEAFRDGLCNQIQAIPDRESIALQNDPRYSRDCGRIGVGFSYNHMLKMHNDPDIRQVIGYHTSSLPAAIKPLTNLDKATDYTPVQNTLKFKGFKKPNYDIPDGVPSYATPPQDVETEFKVGKNGKPTKTRMSKYAKSDATFDIKGKYDELCQTMDGVKAAKETLRQLLQFASDNGLALETSKYKNGHADFDLYGDTEATQNPYLSADNYIEYCISRGLVPMFYEFALNDNYYKDIYDFNVFDRLSYNPETGLHEDSADRKAYAPQVPVHMMNEDGSMAFPEDFWNLVDKYMKDYNYQREDFAKKFPKIMKEVRSIKDSSGKPMISKQGIKYSDRDSFDSLYDESIAAQSRLNELTKTKKDLESSDDYNNLVLGIISAKDQSESERMLNEYNSWLERTKYSEISDEIKELQDKLTQIRKAMNEAADSKAEDDERKKIEKSGLSDADYFRKIAIKEFGYTPFFYDAGYLLPSGKLLNFSGEKGQHFGSRGQDHRAIGTVYANISGGKAMLKFMSEGNIRVMAETPGIDISSTVEPTSAQYTTIKKFVREYAKEKYLAVDITDANGNVVGTYEYENNINADRVVNDIKYYFQNGALREQSSISKFLYSDREIQPITEQETKDLAKHFGTTGNFRVAGYLLTDGKLLDFSGKHWGDTTSRTRQVDHRDVQEVIGNRDSMNGTNAMIDMIGSGNIRLMPEDGGINLAVYPNEKQRRVLSAYINYMLATEGQVIIDYDAVGGDTVYSREYGKTATSRQILTDIRNYFNGARQSELMQFHTMYSDREFPSNAEDIAKKHFGTTTNWSETGWLLTDGTQLDFSGRHWENDPDSEIDLGETYYRGKRNVEHYEIAEAFTELRDFSHMEYRGEHLDGFLSRGNIRIVRKGCIDLQVMPTDEQFKKLRGFFNESIDAHIVIGIGLDGLEFSKGTKASTIIEGIRDYFSKNRGQQSDLMRFHTMYSDRDTDSVSNRSLLANALESVAQNDIERNKLKKYQGKIALIESEQAKLAETKAKIKELSFAKGRRDTEAIKKLQFEANQTANLINTYDRELLNLEASAALKGVLQREKQLAYKKAEKEGKEALAKYREKAAKTQRELLTRYQESRQKGIEGRKKTEMRHKIKNVVNELNQYLLKGTKEKHVPIELQKAVAEALDAVNMDTVNAEERIAKKREEMLKAKTPEAIEKLAKEISNIREMGGNMDAKLARLKTAYDSIINSDDPLIANSHDDVISSSIDKVVEVIGDTPLRDMSLYQLEAVYDLYKMVLHSIRTANKAFKADKSESISIIANGVIAELDAQKKSPKVIKGSDKFLEFSWNNLKPVYAFERIGSRNFTKVFNAVRAGEDVWAKDMSDAEEFRKAQENKHNYESFDFDKTYDFVSATGRGFTLRLDQIMSLYAYSKRGQQAKEHLQYGGFQFDGVTEFKEKKGKIFDITYQLKDKTAYKISDELLDKIIGTLDDVKGAKEFVDEMQEYLSSTMGEKGNEVSLALYDIKLFKEKNYFPLRVSKDFLARKREEAMGEVKIKNSGFTNAIKPNAKNPIVLSSFMDVWASHVNEMSMYHAFVLPLEDFYRVYNYSTPTADNLDTIGVVSALGDAHRDAAVHYIDQLLKDINGGARSDPRESWGKSWVSKFKKASVVASLSVVVQQYSAVIRAMALVNSRYFFGAKPSKQKHKDAWAEIKKYAPVAVIKEMGYFDTGMGKGSVEWLKGEKTFMDKVDDATSKLPALMDELAWVAIWNAVKRETVHTYKHLQPNSDAFLKVVGERFTEVITKTQVYDSTLSRSANMRSKSTFMSMVTSFLAEATTSINMLQDAFRKGNKKYIARTMGAVYGSVILNSALVSIVYAMRDDDEDETFAEKYLSRFTTEVIDGANPLTYLPFVKDIWSIAQGFDIERADMSLISDLVGSFQNLTEVLAKDTSDMDEDELADHKKEVAGSVLGIMDSFSSLAGVPVKNIRRDINGVINTFKTLGSGNETTAGSLGDNILEDVKDSVPVWGWLPDESKGEKLYDAIIKGDEAYIDRFKSGYKSEDSYHSAVKKVVREHLEDGDISATEAERIIVSHGGVSEEDASVKVQYWEFTHQYPDYDLSESAIADYYTEAEPAGISIDVFYDYQTRKKKCQGVDANGDGQTDRGTLKAAIMELIDSLPISDEQKDVLYFLNGWPESTLWEAPWH